MAPSRATKPITTSTTTTASSTSRYLNPPDLTSEQKLYLQRIWKSNERELLDVETSRERQNVSLRPNTYRFVLRLYQFFLALLSHTQEQQRKKQHLEDRQDERTTPSNKNLLKDMHESSLKEFLKMAISRKRPCASSSSKDEPFTQFRLFKGRCVISILHEDFMQEINQYEVNTVQVPPEFIRTESFGAFLYHFPSDALTALGSAMRLALLTLYQSQETNQQQQQQLQNVSPAPPNQPPQLLSSLNHNLNHQQHQQVAQFLDSSQCIVRFLHVQPQVQMMDIKTGLVGKFLTIKGHVVKARPKQLRVATADFRCPKCHATLTHAFESGRYSMPTKCTGGAGNGSSGSGGGDENNNKSNGCKARAFTMLRPTARYIDVQELRLQETQEESTVHAGRTPRQIEVELTHDLVDNCRPGDTVLVAAIVAAVNTAVAAGKTGKRVKETSTYKLYLQGHSVTTMSESNNNRRMGSSQQVNVYTQQQLQRITQLCHADHRYFGLTERRAFPFDLLVRSLCPSIIGHHAVKAGLLLCLLGGTPPSPQASDKEHSIRSNCHLLLVGDPGMGKSQMLLAATQLAARSVYVGGNTSSTTGLTVTLTKEEGGESGIEAGALVLADQGVCCIDEFDKMAKNHQDGTFVGACLCFAI